MLMFGLLHWNELEFTFGTELKAEYAHFLIVSIVPKEKTLNLKEYSQQNSKNKIFKLKISTMFS